MKKISLVASALGFSSLVLSFGSAAFAEDVQYDAYDKAYSKCADNAESDEDNYEHVFTECMKAAGFSEEENYEDDMDGHADEHGSSDE